jgi:hypothetical protein
MYPTKELTLLAAQKIALQRRIAVRRVLVAADFHRATQPVAWMDRMVAFWHRVPPLAKIAAVPLGLFVQRALFPRRNLLGFLLRWSPVILRWSNVSGGAARANAADSQSKGHRG